MINDENTETDSGAKADSSQSSCSASCNWQPIGTAPKNGTEILGWRDDCGIMLIQWSNLVELLDDAQLREEKRYYGDDDHVECEDWFYADFSEGGRLENDEVPTHWMPLPSLPNVKFTHP